MSQPGYFGGSARFGQDSYARITTSTDIQLEASAVLPYEPYYQPLVSFLPPEISSGSGQGGGGSLAAAVGDSGTDEWKAYPERLDLFCYQGDDVQIPLYFQNPADPALDMSNENGWSWAGQVRTWHRYYGYLVHEFVIESEGIPADTNDPDSVAQTLVTLYLPRMHNTMPGVFHWDLWSKGPYVGPDFPKPDDIPAEDWLQDQLKTWLYGYLYVVPRVTTTDWLPMPRPLPTGTVVAVTPTGCYGPNGRVP